MKPFYERDGITIYCGDCLEIMPQLDADSATLIFVDWPYYRVKDEPWDRQWDNSSLFLDWIGQTLEQAKRLLKPNGSFYGCASPGMSSRIEVKVSEYFAVLNNIRWTHHGFTGFRADREAMRSYMSPWEAIIFAEQYSGDGVAAGESGYFGQCKELHKQIYSPVFGDYLQSEFERAGVTRKEIAALFPSRTGNLTGCVSNWILGYNCPSKDQYIIIRDYLNDLNCKTDYLRRDYEDLRRPFNSNPNALYTDIWTFKPVKDYPGKHPTEKPLAMMEHVIEISSRPGDLVLDFCMGSGTTLIAARNLGRQAIGIDKHRPYCNAAVDRLRQPSFFSIPNQTNGNVKTEQLRLVE